MIERKEYSFYLFNDNQILMSQENQAHNFPRGEVRTSEPYSSALSRTLSDLEICTTPIYLFLSKGYHPDTFTNESCAVYIGRLSSCIKNDIVESHNLRWETVSDLLKGIQKHEGIYDPKFVEEFKKIVRNRKIIRKI